MKKILLIILSLFILPVHCLAEQSIPLENQVILDSVPDFFPNKKTWGPTVDDTQKALSAIYEFLKNPEKDSLPYPDNFEYKQREIKKINENLSKYNVQFVGIIAEGKKRVFCNFFPSQGFDKWKSDLIFVLDGGFWFWRIEYDMDTGKCLNFDSNGYA